VHIARHLYERPRSTLSHIKADPRFETLQSNARFAELLQRMGVS